MKKGITLIALVITIIVLLILAGVTINTLMGEGGVLKQATDAKTQMSKAEEIENIGLSAISTLQKYGYIYKDGLENEMSENFSNVTLEGSEEGPWTYEGTNRTYLIYKDGTVEEKQDYSELAVGDYVNYPVYYDNCKSYENQYKPTDEYNGWRILSIDRENNVIRIVTTGIPLTYFHLSSVGGAAVSIKNLTVNFLDTPITNTGSGFRDVGIKYEENGEKIDSSEDLNNLFNNRFTDKYKRGTTIKFYDEQIGEVQNELETDMPKVQSLIYDDMAELTQVSNLKAIPTEIEDIDAYYWIAQVNNNGSHLHYYNGTRKCLLNNYGGPIGIRIVVTLAPNIGFTKDLTITDNNMWNLE